MHHFLNRVFLAKVLHRRNHRQEFPLPGATWSKDIQRAQWPFERLLCWFLLCWIGLVYAQGLLFLSGSQPFGRFQAGLCLATFPPQGACFFANMFVTLHDFPRPAMLTLFTFLMSLHGVVLWAGLGGKVRRHFSWQFFLLQGMLFLAVCLIEQQTYLVLSLYLALVLGALGMLKRARPVLIILCCYSVLLLGFSYSSFVSMQILYKQGLIGSIPSWNMTNYTALILFVVGYLVLYVQQVHAHRQIAAYANRIEALTGLTERHEQSV